MKESDEMNFLGISLGIILQNEMLAFVVSIFLEQSPYP